MERGAALLFDLDGTIVDSAIGIAAALSSLSTSRGGAPVQVCLVRDLVSQGVESLVRGALGAVAGDSADDIARFRELLEQLPSDRTALYPGVVRCLEQLDRHGYRCAIVTNKPERLSRLLLEGLDLTKFFDVIVGGDTIALGKPDPAPLRFALEMMDRSSHDAVMIGDSAVDAGASAAAGIPFILFEGGYGAAYCNPDHVAARFSNFAMLEGVISAVAAGRV